MAGQTTILDIPWAQGTDAPPSIEQATRPLAERVEEVVLAFAPVEVVTELPSSPVDGQEVYYLAAAEVVWHLKYRSAAAAPYKWLYLGGHALFSEVATDEFKTSVEYTDLATVGPSLTVPLAGKYRWEIAGLARNEGGVATSGFMSAAFGAAAATDVNAAEGRNSRDGEGRALLRIREVTLAADTAVVAKYRTDNSSQGCWFANRTMRLTPIRVG